MLRPIDGLLILKPQARLTNGDTIPLEFEVSQREEADGVALYDVPIRHTGPEPIAVKAVRLFELDLEEASIEVYRQGFFMPSDPSGFATLQAGHVAPSSGPWKGAMWGTDEFISHTLAVIGPSNQQRPCLFGFTTGCNYEGLLVFQTGGETIKMSAWLMLEGIMLTPHEPVHLEQFMVVEDTPFEKCLEVYATITGRTNAARVPRNTTTGWIDWQYYREEKTEDDILRNVEALKALRQEGFPLETVIVDGGWCEYASEWLKPCAKFPRGMKFLSEQVREAGFKFGLWFAPYITNINTEVARNHPDWMVKDAETGDPLHRERSNVGPRYVIDFTIPEALQWLGKTVGKVVHEWQVSYLKLDGPALGHYRGGVLHNQDMTLVQMMRKSLEAIREACGDEVLIEGEGIYLPAIGLVDTQRTMQDTCTHWYAPETGRPRLKDILKDDLLSSFMHGRLWHNHRENVVLRDSLSPFHARGIVNPDTKDTVLTDNEVRFQVSAAALSGGAMLLSDPVDELRRNPRRIELISQFLPHYEGTGCYPLDAFQGDGRQPALYCLPVRTEFEEWYVIGVFNWEDSYRNYVVPINRLGDNADWHAFEFWDQEYLGRHEMSLPVKDVPPHGCKIIALRKATNRLQFLGTNMHILQGAMDLDNVREQNGALEVTVSHFMQRERRIVLWRPSATSGLDIETDAIDYVMDARKPNLLTIQFNGHGRTAFRIR